MFSGRSLFLTNYIKSFVFSSRTSREIVRTMSKDSSHLPKLQEKDNKLAVFTQRFNPLTGQREWDTQDENYDFHQEIARSAYADMLHDGERNKKYFEALKWAVVKHKQGGTANRVLDIGTGTGLLSMMAASLDADEVTACEAFLPVSECAKSVMESNGFAGRIRLVPKRSTELTVGPDGDMPRRANVLITEVFDTELIGEGAISTFNHAHKHLLEDDCLVVPARATVYVQAVQSKLLSDLNRPKPLSLPGNLSIEPYNDISACPGSAAVLDLQMSHLPEGSFTVLCDPVAVAWFDFSSKTPIPTDESTMVRTLAKTGGYVDAFLFWWDLDMTADGSIQLSCAPWWIHEDGREQPWRDHWMQAVFFPRNPLPVAAGSQFDISCSHDEYSFWFDVHSNGAGRPTFSELTQPVRRPTCTCGYHIVCNPFRIGALNDSVTNDKYISVLQKLIQPYSVCLCTGDGGSLLPLMAARLGAKKVFVIDSNSHSVKVLKSFINKNDLEGVVSVIEKNAGDVIESDMDGLKADLILSEPYYMTSLLPWHNLQFAYQLASLDKLKAVGCRTMPIGATLWAVGMDFTHLHKIKARLGDVEGFQMRHFDNLIESMHIADAAVEPHPLWEYEGIALTKPFQLASFDLTKALVSLTTEGSIKIESEKSCNGVALWMDWNLDSTVTLSRGPTKPFALNSSVTWDINSKQGVCFLPNDSEPQLNQLNHYVAFDAKNGALRLRFEVK